MSDSASYENPYATDDITNDARVKGVKLPLELSGNYDQYDITSVRSFQNPIQLITDTPMTVKISEEYIEFENKLGQTRYSWKNTKSVRIVGTCAVIQCGSFHGSLIIPKHWCPVELWEPLIERIKRIISNSDQLNDFEIPQVEIPEAAFELKRKLVSTYEQFVHLKIFNIYLPWSVYVRGFIGIALGIGMFQVDTVLQLMNIPNNTPILLILIVFCIGIFGFTLAIPFLAQVLIRNIISPPLFLIIMIYFRFVPPKIDTGPCWFEEEKSCLFTKYVQSIAFWNHFEALILHDHVVCIYAPTMLKCIYRSQFETTERWNEFVDYMKTKIAGRMTFKDFQRMNPIITQKEMRVMQKKVRSEQVKH